MKRNQYGNDSNHWDTLESRLFERFLADPDRSSDSYRHNGTYTQYESYEDDGNIASYYRGSYESRNQGQHSGHAAGGSWLDNEVMARQLQEMSIHGEDSGSTTRAMMGQPWHGSYGSYLEDDEAIARELHQSYNSYVADDDAAIARELQETEDSLGTMALYDGAFGSIIDSAWEGNLGGTSANRGGTSANHGGSANRGGTSANHGGSANRGGTSIRETNVQTRDGGEVDLDNMSYEEMHRFEESMGSVSKGLSREAISRLPVHKYSPSSTRSNSGDAECVICKMEYERGDRLVTLPCAHQYHEDCVKKWFEDNKNCCVCKEDVAVN